VATAGDPGVGRRKLRATMRRFPMNTVRRGTVIALVMLLAGCGDAGPAAPTDARQPPVSSAPNPPPAKSFPPPSGPSRTFVFGRELLYPVSGYTSTSRFVLYDNGAFVLQFPSLGEPGYRGGYQQVNAAITFEWEGWNIAGPWGATGTLSGDLLTVRYNEVMQGTDFEDAVYVLMR